MRIAKTVTLIFMLVFGALALELLSPEQVEAADDLQDTQWFEQETGDGYYFNKGGWVGFSFVNKNGEIIEIRGKYRLNGKSVEMIFEDGARASATISGKKMRGKTTFEDGGTHEFVLERDS